MRRLLLLLLTAATTAAVVQAKEPDAPVRVHPDSEIIVSSHFTDGMMDGWESYPFVEDDGFDQTLFPVDEPGVHGIVRRVLPLANGAISLGFIRPLYLTSSAQSRISFRYKILGAHDGNRLQVKLFSGKESQIWEVTPGGDGWQYAELALTSAKDAISWTALSIELVAPHELKDTQIEFMLTDVTLSGKGVPRLQLDQPAALWDEARSTYYLRRSYLRGETLAFHFASQAKLSLTCPDGSRAITDPYGVYKIKSSDPAGIWTLHAVSKEGEANVEILVQDDKKAGLYFDILPLAPSGLLDQIADQRNELAGKVHADLGRNIAQFDARWLLPGLPSYFKLLVPPSELALDDAILYRYRHDEHALEESRRILHSMCSWPAWVHPWFYAHGQRTYYPVGLAAANIAATRQFLGDALTADEKHSIDQALIEKAVVPAYEEYVAGNRLPFSVSNWIGNTVGGSLLAALTMDNRDAAGYILGLLAKDREHLRAAYTPDGDYGEGSSYLRFDLEMSSLVACGVERRLHVNLEPALRDADRYLRNATYGERRLVDFGDVHTDLKSTDVFAYLAAESPSKETAAFYRMYRYAQSERPLLRLLWDAAAMQRGDVPASKPTSAVYPQRGVVLMRNNASSGATVAAMRAGANFNHNHADQGEVQIVSGGETVLGESGYADYYKDPSFASYVIQAAGHNVLLVDGNSMSQSWPGNSVAGAHPYFTQSWLGEKVDIAAADLASVYGDALSGYERWLIDLHDGPIIVVDRMRSDIAHKYELVWHPENAAEVVANGLHSVYAIGSRTAPWHLVSASSISTRSELTRGPLPLDKYAAAESQWIGRPIELHMQTMNAAKAAEFITIAAPVRDGSDQLETRFNVETTTVKSPNWNLQILQPGNSNAPKLVFTSTYATVLLDARDWSDGQKMLHATVPVDLELDKTTNGTKLVLRSELPGSLTVRGFGQLAQRSDGTIVHATAGGTNELMLPLIKGVQVWQLGQK